MGNCVSSVQFSMRGGMFSDSGCKGMLGCGPLWSFAGSGGKSLTLSPALPAVSMKEGMLPC